MLDHVDPDCTGKWIYPSRTGSQWSGGVEPYAGRCRDFAKCLTCGAEYYGHEAVVQALQEERLRLDMEILQAEGQQLFAESLCQGDRVEANLAVFHGATWVWKTWVACVVVSRSPRGFPEVAPLDGSHRPSFALPHLIRAYRPPQECRPCRI